MYPPFPSVETLSLAQQVAQLLVVRTTGHLFDPEIQYPQWEANHAQLRHYLQDLGVGGVILLGGSAVEVGMRSQFLQSLAQIPLLIAADIEEGVGQRFSGATWLPPLMALGEIAARDLPQALAYAEAYGRCTAQEALAIGLNWLLAPVVDVNNNPANPVINVRAFGDDPTLVSQLAQAFIRGTKAYPVLTTAKHFPGHGDTATDSHLTLPVVPHALARLEQVELVPFQGAIAAQVDSIMTAHICLPQFDQTYPATLSKPILTGLLRQQLNFQGLIVTDALVMGAITETYGPHEGAILALQAGADILLMPSDPAGTIAAVCAAVESGRLASDQIQRSVERLWQAKGRTLALASETTPSHAWEQPLTPPLPQWQALAQGENRQLQHQILAASQHQGGGKLPSVPAGRNLILVDTVLGCRYLPRTAPALLQPALLGYGQLQCVDSQWQPAQVLTAAEPLPTLLQLFIRGNPFRSSAALIALAREYAIALHQQGCLAGVAIYGSPYVQAHLDLPGALPWVFSYGQMPEAQALALDALFGRPIAIAVHDVSFTD